MARVVSAIAHDEFEPIRLAEHAATLLGIAAGKAKDLFGALLERATGNPVVILKKDRPAVVVVPAELYLTLIRDREELLTRKAMEIAGQQGYLSEKETAAFEAEINRLSAL